MDKVAVQALRQAIQSKDIIIVDEIGKMEMFSASFKEAVIEALESKKQVLGTIMLASHPWADKIKERPEVEVIKVTRFNRDEVIKQVLAWIGALSP
jgi:nucleoside-triphosphatase THEP1